MVEQLIDLVVERFSAPGESERQFLERLKRADQQLTANFRSITIGSTLYADPLVRAAYLLRYLGHYTLQLGDLLRRLEDHERVSHLFAQPELSLVSSCAGPCPELIALAIVHAQGGGQQLRASVVDLQTPHWSDCWSLTATIARQFAAHPDVRISGIQADLLAESPPDQLSRQLRQARVFTLMNGLNEGIARDEPRLHQRMEALLRELPAGALVLFSDQARYEICRAGMAVLQALLIDLGAEILDAEIKAPQTAENRFDLPARISWIYSNDNNRFRINNRTLHLAALMP